jgi:hypothetical protein
MCKVITDKAIPMRNKDKTTICTRPVHINHREEDTNNHQATPKSLPATADMEVEPMAKAAPATEMETSTKWTLMASPLNPLAL